ncbi:hypothetical protein OS493_027070 [Desmophyllum pertusum]|uniref:Uncharacterized protein n=1 Tax=Desmophyllum pertusum TaxID=174260 RepID=A0A9W9Y9H7_9CNID|nr:hypothetical protein OS493_027070 [Desmophyllum pertusum]
MIIIILAFSKGEMCALIGTMEEQPVPFCIEHMGRQESTRYFHSAFIKDQVTVRFQLVNQVRRNFRLKDPQMAEKVITVPQIKSLSQRWMEPPGAIAEMCLESLGEVGQLCENHLRIIMEIWRKQLRICFSNLGNKPNSNKQRERMRSSQILYIGFESR